MGIDVAGAMANSTAGSTDRWHFDFQLDKSPAEALYSSFFMIMATELGDETFIIAAVMAMRHPKLVVLSGALAALYFMTVLSAVLGVVLPNLISQKTVHSCATLLYTFFGLRLMYIGTQGEEESKEDEFSEVENHLKEDTVAPSKSAFRRMFARLCTPVFLQAGILTFLAEWGDRSQIATITLAAHQHPLGVIVGAIVGHTICTSLAVFGGEWLGKRISHRFVAFAGGFLFLLFAIINFVTTSREDVAEPAHIAMAADSIIQT